VKGRVRLAIILLFFTAAPTAGDIGSSCQPEDDLDPVKFWGVKQAIDRQRCEDCSIPTKACSRARDPGLIFKDFPKTCAPLEHDGEVCLDALLAASCKDYRSFMSDEAPTIPTECDFCPLAGAPGADGGAGGAGGSGLGGSP
jgi:hypothetical protein